VCDVFLYALFLRFEKIAKTATVLSCQVLVLRKLSDFIILTILKCVSPRVVL